MYIQDQIISSIPVFELGETLGKVILFFEETTHSHVAVTENGLFLGLLSENDLGCFEADKKIEEFRYELEAFSAAADMAWLDVMELFARNEANVLPVVDGQQKVTGYYRLEDIVRVFIDTPFFREPGSILVIATGTKDYSFSELAQIVESNNARLLGAFITESGNDMVQITLKIGTQSLNEVIQTFRRYSYNIIYGNSDDQFMEDMKQRSDYLEKYLNV